MRTIYLTWGTFAAVTTVALVAVTLTAISTREVFFTNVILETICTVHIWSTTRHPPPATLPSPIFGAKPTKPSLHHLSGLMLRR